MAFCLTGEALYFDHCLPGQNDLNVAANTGIWAMFEGEMDPASFSNASFVVNAGQTGKHTGSVSYVYNPAEDPVWNYAYHIPSNDFATGEVVTVTLTDDILPASPTRTNYLGLPFVWQFIIEAEAGTGAFADPLLLEEGDSPSDIAPADLDNDNDMDIAISNQGSYGAGYDGTVSVYKNNGDGTFTSAIEYDVGTQARAVCAGDFNMDGNIDLATAEYHSGVSILFNTGNAVFQTAVNYPYGGAAIDLCSGDLNGDGYFDLAIVDHGGGIGRVAILLNNGDGTFSGAGYYSYGPSVFDDYNSITSADLDDDGDIDLAVGIWMSNDKSMGIFLNNGDGSFQASESPLIDVYSQITNLEAADLDNDGDADLIGWAVLSGDVYTFINNGDATFVTMAIDGWGGGPNTLADMNADGNIDIIFSHGLSLGNGDGTFQDPYIYYDGGGTWQNCAADFNGDGALDIGGANDNVVILNLPPSWACGDIDGEEGINILDIVFLINYLYKDGTAPDPLESANVNYGESPDDLINILDIVYLINFLYKDGADLACP
jgi:hypothetical protein